MSTQQQQMSFPPDLIASFFASLSSEQGLRLFDALPDTRLFVKDANGVYMHVSQGMVLAHGFIHENAILGRTDYDFIPASLADQYTRDDKRVLEGNEIWGRVEMVMRHPQCHDWYLTSKIPLRAKDGRIVGLAGISRDLEKTARFASPFTQLAPVLEYIREEFAAPFDLALLAQHAGMSERSFQRHFKKAFQMTPSGYLRQFRIGKVCQMLLETDETISAIAQETGFTDHSHLIREFASAMGSTPSAYRTRYR